MATHNNNISNHYNKNSLLIMATKPQKSETETTKKKIHKHIYYIYGDL